LIGTPLASDPPSSASSTPVPSALTTIVTRSKSASLGVAFTSTAACRSPEATNRQAASLTAVP
jgi:hypothetical protein